MQEYRITARTTLGDIRDHQPTHYFVWRSAEYVFEFYDYPSPEHHQPGSVVVYSFKPDGKQRWSGSTSFYEWSDRAVDAMRSGRASAALRDY